MEQWLGAVAAHDLYIKNLQDLMTQITSYREKFTTLISSFDQDKRQYDIALLGEVLGLQDNVYKIIKRMRGDGMLEEDAPSGVMAVSPDIRIVLAALSREPSW